MMAPLSLAAVLLLAASALATPAARAAPPPTAPFTKVFNAANLKDLVKRDQERAQAMISSRRSTASKRAVPHNVPITNEVFTYIANVSVGSPPTVFSLIVDTGSSNTWVGATTPFKATATTEQTGADVAVQYGSGEFSGIEVIDRVELAPGLVIEKQSIGVANQSQGFEGVDGIVGIGPVILTEGTLSTGNAVEIPTVTDNLFATHAIPLDLVSVSFKPTAELEQTNGELTFGGIDETKFIGPITFVPVTKTSPSTFFWGINETIALGDHVILENSAGIVDTGTSLVLLASNVFQEYLTITGGTLDVNNTGLVIFTPEQFARLPTLNYVIEGRIFPLTPNAQIIPRALNSAFGVAADVSLGVVNDLGSIAGQGLDFINGMFFLERFYSVFDTTNNRVGFADTIQTFV